MKIGLIDIDGHNFPNLALMKISAYHKSINDYVEWFNIDHYDIAYASKVFTFTPDFMPQLGDYHDLHLGGTGYASYWGNLPSKIDKMCPDYSIYPQFKEAYGFLTRGCPNKCAWCIVPEKEGNIQPYADIEEFLDGRKTAILMDNNVLAHEHGLKQIEKIIKLGIKVDFNQGLDARLITDEIAQLLSKVKWYKPLRMACDTEAQMSEIARATRLLRKYNTTPSNYFIYVLVKDIQSALRRVEFLRELKLDPFAQPYRDYKTNHIDKGAKQFARWVNHKAIFKTVEYVDYR
jgi:radical SAM superfamily enzyme YgiQ (UPF0313 family)